jgi:poly(3-hydroxybutyrate) depolymerase
MWLRDLITIDTYHSMRVKIKSKLEPGQVYLTGYSEAGAILRNKIALEFAETCLALTSKVEEKGQ